MKKINKPRSKGLFFYGEKGEKMKKRNQILDIIDTKDVTLKRKEQIKNREEIIMRKDIVKDTKKKNQRLIIRGKLLEDIILEGKNLSDKQISRLLKILKSTREYKDFFGSIKSDS